MLFVTTTLVALTFVTLSVAAPVGHQQTTISGFVSATWPKGDIPYRIDPSIDSFDQKRIVDAIRSINEAWFCAQFRPKLPNDSYSMNFVRHSGFCHSQWIGFADVGDQSIYLAPNCTSTRYIFWAIFQALGLPAEHQRPDRDNYLTINWENIDEKYRYAFYRYSFIDPRLEALPYDRQSRLHYSSDKMSIRKGVKTMVSKEDPDLALGNPVAPSQGDYEKLAALYCGRPASTTSSPSTTTTTTTTTTTSKPPISNRSIIGPTPVPCGLMAGLDVIICAITVQPPTMPSSTVRTSVPSTVPSSHSLATTRSFARGALAGLTSFSNSGPFGYLNPSANLTSMAQQLVNIRSKNK